MHSSFRWGVTAVVVVLTAMCVIWNRLAKPTDPTLARPVVGDARESAAAIQVDELAPAPGVSSGRVLVSSQPAIPRSIAAYLHDHALTHDPLQSSEVEDVLSVIGKTLESCKSKGGAIVPYQSYLCLDAMAAMQAGRYIAVAGAVDPIATADDLAQKLHQFVWTYHKSIARSAGLQLHVYSYVNRDESNAMPFARSFVEERKRK